MTSASTTRRYTAVECEAILDELDKGLEEREERIKLSTRGQWDARSTMSRLGSLLFAHQVTQREDMVVDSPYLQFLERGCSSDLAAQRADYQSIVDGSETILDIARTRSQELSGELSTARAAPGDDAEPDMPAHLDGTARQAIAEHDRAVLAKHRQATLDGLEGEVQLWGAVARHAESTKRTAEANLGHAVRMVKSHYAASAMAHIKWAMKDRIKSPYLLPGCLQGEEIIDQKGATCSY